MKKYLFPLMTSALLFSCAVSASAQFVEVSGNQFKLNNQPYYFAGTNFWYGAYLGAPEAGDRQRLLKELDLLQQHGINNLRVLAASENSYLEKSVKPSIQNRPGEFNESLLVGLDFLLAEMAKRDMQAVLYLNNFWQWSGGMTQYLQWADKITTPDPDVTGDWDAYIGGAASFYRSQKANHMFRDFIKSIVERKNSVNGINYIEDPTIMAWELANEPRAGINNLPASAKQPFLDWVTDTAEFIKSLDANHLVTTGNEGTAGTSGDADLFINAHKPDSIDYLTVHLWPKNWSWLDMDKAEETYPQAVNNAITYLDQHLAIAQQLDKPIVLEEFGVERDYGNYAADGTTKYRDRFFKTIFTYIEEQAAQGEAIAGSNFWGWGGIGNAAHKDFEWREGDEFTGDPPQEPQGLNSVFANDTTTLRIIQQHSKNLQTLAKPMASAE